MITFSCECGKRYQVKDELVGKRAKCSCGKTLVIPQPTASSQQRESARPSVLYSPSAGAKSNSHRQPRRLVFLVGISGVVLIILASVVWIFSHGRGASTRNSAVAQEAKVGEQQSEKKGGPVSIQRSEAPNTTRQQPEKTAEPTTGNNDQGVSLASLAGHWYGMSINLVQTEFLIDDQGGCSWFVKSSGGGAVGGETAINKVAGSFSTFIDVFSGDKPLKLTLSDDGQSLNVLGSDYSALLKRQMPNDEAKKIVGTWNTILDDGEKIVFTFDPNGVLIQDSSSEGKSKQRQPWAYMNSKLTLISWQDPFVVNWSDSNSFTLTNLKGKIVLKASRKTDSH